MKNLGVTFYFDTPAELSAFMTKVSGGQVAPAPAAVATVAPAPVQPAASGVDELGNPIGTQYWWNAAHESVFKIRPGDPESSLTLQSQPLTPAQFKKTQEQLAIKFAHLQGGAPAGAVASPAPAPAPAAAAAAFDPFAADGAAVVSADPMAGVPAVVDGAALLAKFKELDAAKGRPAMMAVLDGYGCTTIGQLAQKHPGKERQVYASILQAMK